MADEKKVATRFLFNVRNFPPGTPQEFKDVFLRVLDTLNGTQSTAYDASDTAAGAQETATGAQETAGSAQETADAAQAGVTDLNGRVVTLESDSVSKSATGVQELAGALGIKNYLNLDGVKVLGPQESGWTANSGTATKGGAGAFSQTVGATFTQSEVQAIADAAQTNRELLTAIIAALLSHGLMGP